jgi:hypothetical protein
MPAKSKQQYGLMAGVMSGSIKGSGLPSQATAKEFVKATPAKKRSQFAKQLKKHKREK